MKMKKALLAALILLTSGWAWADDPITVNRFSLNYSAVYNEFDAPEYIYGNGEVTNNSSLPLTEVRIQVRIVDGYGRDLDTALMSDHLHTLAPGERFEFDWTWYNRTAVIEVLPKLMMSGMAGDEKFNLVKQHSNPSPQGLPGYESNSRKSR